MKNLISWFEIPVKDLERAKNFYSAILDIDIKITEMMGSFTGFFPSENGNVSGALVEGSDYIPSTDGILIYLNGGNDLNEALSLSLIHI